MDEKTIKVLSQIIDERFNKRAMSMDSKKRINSTLHNKSISTVIRELRNYTYHLSGRYKNISTVIVVMSLLRRSLDSILKVKDAVVCNELEGQLFGGLFIFLTGNSSSLAIDIKLNDFHFENKYEFITRFSDFQYWDYIELFLAAKLLSMIDPHKFEKLALEDRTKLILLNMASHNMDVLPSKELISKLLNDDDELKQNIGFYFANRSILKCISDIDHMKRSEKNGVVGGTSHREIRNDRNTAINECCVFLENCNERKQAALLTNFLLVHQTTYPIAFARKLLSSDFQESFIYQIRNTGKIKTLQDLAFITNLISITPALNKEKKRISKYVLYIEIINIILNFVDNKKGIYGWNEQQSIYMDLICQRLPVRCIKKLRFYLSVKDKSLMYNKLDEMIRFQIYLEDSRQHEIISGIIVIIDRYAKKG